MHLHFKMCYFCTIGSFLWKTSVSDGYVYVYLTVDVRIYIVMFLYKYISLMHYSLGYCIVVDIYFIYSFGFMRCGLVLPNEIIFEVNIMSFYTCFYDNACTLCLESHAL